MRKFIVCLLNLILIIILTSCGQSSAEIVIDNGNGEEVFYINPTSDSQEVVNVINNLTNAKIDKYNYTGVKLKFDINLEGAVNVGDEDQTQIDLAFDILCEVNANLKDFIALGTLKLDGFTKTDSNKLLLDSKYIINGDIVNDLNYLYLNGAFELGIFNGNSKVKLDISEFVNEYKPIVNIYLDLLKYYRITSLIEDVSKFVSDYNVVITKTTKDTFTLKLEVMASKLDSSIKSDELVGVEVTLSCKNLLPVALNFNADQVIAEILKETYLKQYLTENLDIRKANLNVNLTLEYGQYKIEGLSEEEKSQYELIDIE